MSIGERLKEIRGKMLQEDFGKLFGVYKGTVANYEKGIRKPDSEYLNNVLQHFPEINPTWLLTGHGQMRQEKSEDQPAQQMIPKNAPQQDLTNDPLQAAFLRDWCSLSEVGKMHIWMLLKAEMQKEKDANKEVA
jgi:transcriptional regulator with XRE-family HTH domain